MTPRFIWEAPEKAGKALRAEVTSYRGSRPFLNLREWYRGDGDELLAGRRGVTIPLDHVAAFHRAIGDWLANHKPGESLK